MPLVRVWVVCCILAVHAGSLACADELYVSDRVGNRVLRFDPVSGAYLGELIGPGNPLSASDLLEPSAMTLGPGNTLLVASRVNGKVLRFDRQTGAFLGELAAGLNGPSGLLYDASLGTLFVSELGNFDAETIQRLDASTGASLGSFGAGTGPTGRSDLVRGPDGLLYVSGFFDGRILRFDPVTGNPQGVNPLDPTATFATSPLGFVGAGGLAFDAGGRLDVVGLFSANVFQFDSSGATTGELIGAGAGLVFPADLLLAPDGTLLVTSLGNDDPLMGPLLDGFIGRYDPLTGAAIDPFLISGSGGLRQPTSLLLVGDTAAQIVPEPAGAVLGGLSALGWAAWRCVARRRGVRKSS